MVMRSHGIDFKKLVEGEQSNNGDLLLAPTVRGHETIDGVAAWLGFDDSTDYIWALSQERGFIFRRATY